MHWISIVGIIIIFIGTFLLHKGNQLNAKINNDKLTSQNTELQQKLKSQDREIVLLQELNESIKNEVILTNENVKIESSIIQEKSQKNQDELKEANEKLSLKLSENQSSNKLETYLLNNFSDENYKLKRLIDQVRLEYSLQEQFELGDARPQHIEAITSMLDQLKVMVEETNKLKILAKNTESNLKISLTEAFAKDFEVYHKWAINNYRNFKLDKSYDESRLNNLVEEYIFKIMNIK